MRGVRKSKFLGISEVCVCVWGGGGGLDQGWGWGGGVCACTRARSCMNELCDHLFLHFK